MQKLNATFVVHYHPPDLNKRITFVHEKVFFGASITIAKSHLHAYLADWRNNTFITVEGKNLLYNNIIAIEHTQP